MAVIIPPPPPCKTHHRQGKSTRPLTNGFLNRDALRVVFDDLALQIQQSLSEQIARVSGNALSIKVMDFTMLEEEKY